MVVFREPRQTTEAEAIWIAAPAPRASRKLFIQSGLADRARFELAVGLTPHPLSRRAH